MSDEPARFGPVDVLQIASKLTIDDATFVIGGQATNLWAWFYQDRAPELSSGSELTSKEHRLFRHKEGGREPGAGAWWEGLSSKCRRYEHAKHRSCRGRDQREEVADRLNARRSGYYKTRVGKRHFGHHIDDGRGRECCRNTASASSSTLQSPPPQFYLDFACEIEAVFKTAQAFQGTPAIEFASQSSLAIWPRSSRS
ncbi:hypothetical protein MPLSOD_200009 [Mesorhizobium sp. SOD10]|nr:hypothetical protein MPLSOD_200009 [Mesorhizobium sp. SOD10]